MPILECQECGAVKVARSYEDCANKHKAVGMAKVMGWGIDGEPESLKQLWLMNKDTSKIDVRK